MEVDRLFENSRSLLSSALVLRGIGRPNHAAFFAIICLEELVKLLILKDAGKKVFQHKKKHKYLGFFHFTLGQLSVVYKIKRAAEDNLLGGSEKDREIVLENLKDYTGVATFETLLESVSRYEQSESFLGGHTIDLTDDIRKRAIYCDYVDDGWLDWRSLNETDLDDYVDDAVFAVALVDLVRKERFSFFSIMDSIPNKYNFEGEYDEMRKRVLNQISMKGEESEN